MICTIYLNTEVIVVVSQQEVYTILSQGFMIMLHCAIFKICPYLGSNNYYAHEKPPCCVPEFQRLADILITEENLQVPSNVKEALSLYFDLINLIEE